MRSATSIHQQRRVCRVHEAGAKDAMEPGEQPRLPVERTRQGGQTTLRSEREGQGSQKRTGARAPSHRSSLPLPCERAESRRVPSKEEKGSVMTPEERSILEEKFLLALLKRDAKIWHSRATRSIHALDDIEEAEPKEKRQRKTFLSEIPCNKCGSHRRFTGSGYKCVQCSTEKAKRVDDIKREARKLTPPVPRGRGAGIDRHNCSLRTRCGGATPSPRLLARQKRRQSRAKHVPR